MILRILYFFTLFEDVIVELINSRKLRQVPGLFYFQLCYLYLFLLYFYPMQITGIILAGGQSTRMGTDKALLQINDKTLLENAIEICRPVCSEILISSGNPEHKKFGYQIVPDEIKNCGPIGGIYSCLKKSETLWNLVLSVDALFVTSEFLQYLALQKDKFEAVIPKHPGGVEPLVSLYNKNALFAFEVQIRKHDYKMQNLLRLISTSYVDCDKWLIKNRHLFDNLNSLDDLKLIR